MVNAKTIAVIPARGGSKRIPRKNMINFDGRPMIAWTIDAACGSGLFDRVVVSTDDPEIADVSRAHGAEVPFMRDQHADDHATVSAATVRAVEQAEETFGETYDTVCQLMANCPLRGADDIRAHMTAFQGRSAHFQISCFKFGWMNPWWAVKLGDGGRPEALFPNARESRSQDLGDLYCPTGAIWIAHTAALKDAGTFYGEGIVYEPMNWRNAVDIDDNDDLDMARAIHLVMRQDSMND